MVACDSVALPLAVITPVHMAGSGTGLTVIGAAASAHVLSRFALTPVFGRICDQYGRRTGLVTGSTLLLLAVAVLGSAGHDTLRLGVGLVLLGLGWSACLVSSSVLVGESVPGAHRVRVQGVADMTTGLSAAAAGLVASPVLGVFGYQGLVAATALPVVALVVAHLRGRRALGATPPSTPDRH
jgi:MFS family permease